MSAKEKEPEITPEMLRAGTQLVKEFDADFDDPEQTAIAIFKAMIAARDASLRA